MYIPSELGYGDRGSPPKIKGGDVLIFRMEILEITGDKVPALPPCNVKTFENCDEKQKSFVEKMMSQTKDEISGALSRLTSMDVSKIAGKAKDWIHMRITLLKQLLSEVHSGDL